MTTTSSTGFISSRPETPNATERDYIDGGAVNPPLNVRGLSMDSRDAMDSRAAIRHIPEEDKGGYQVDPIPMRCLVNEKDYL